MLKISHPPTLAADLIPCQGASLQQSMQSSFFGPLQAGVHFTLCGGSICNLGTERHHREFLSDLDTLKERGCFAMTELGHGSNVMGIETTVCPATLSSPDTLHMQPSCRVLLRLSWRLQLAVRLPGCSWDPFHCMAHSLCKLKLYSKKTYSAVPILCPLTNVHAVT